MAEVLSVVSGGAGIVSLAAQLLTSAQALKGFIANAKNAPHRLTTLAFDIETLGMMLQEFEPRPLEGREAITVLLDRCILSVQSQVRIVGRHVERLENVLKKSRVRGRFLVAFEDPEIERLLDGLERAKISLLHAHLMYMDIQRTRENTDNQQELVARLDQLLSTNASSRRSLETTSEKEYLQAPQAPLGSQRDTRKLTKQRFSVTLRSCLSRHVCTLIMSHATLLPSLSLHTWTQGSSSPAFKYCRNGDIMGLRRTLSDGYVRPRDRDMGNFTLLGLAAMAGNVDICLLLMNQCGLRTDFDAIDNAITVLAINPNKWTGRLLQYQNMFRFLFEKSAIDYDIDEDIQNVNSVPHWLFACPDMETLRMILRNQSVFNPETPLFRPDQLLDVEGWYVHRLQNPEVLLTLFNVEWSFNGLLQLPYEIKLHVLHLSAKKLGMQCYHCPSHWDNEDMPWSRVRWLRLVRDLIVAGVDPTDIKGGRTALLCIWRFSTFHLGEDPQYGYDMNRMKVIFDFWIQTMQDAHLDIGEYIQSEQRAWLALDGHRHFDEQPAKSSLWFRPWKIEKLMGMSPSEDSSFTFRAQKTLHIWREHRIPGSWGNGVQSSIRNPLVTYDDDSPGTGWREVRSISTLSSPVDVRQFQKPGSHQDARLITTIENTQDDAGALALAELWRQSNHRRTARRRSRSVPLRATHERKMNEEWSSRWHTWLPSHHLWPITMFEHSPMLKRRRPCSCLNVKSSEFDEYRPYWYRVVCNDEGKSSKTGDRERLHSLCHAFPAGERS